MQAEIGRVVVKPMAIGQNTEAAKVKVETPAQTEKIEETVEKPQASKSDAFSQYPSNPMPDEPMTYEQKLKKMFEGLDDAHFVKMEYLPAATTIQKKMSEMGFGASLPEAEKLLEMFKKKYPKKTLSYAQWQKSSKKST